MAVDPDAKLRDCAEEQAGVWLPGPLNARLDALVESANDAGENTSRKELLATLLLESPTEGSNLVAAIRRYRTARAREAVPPGVPQARVLGPRDRKPGPRPRRPPT